MSTDQEQLLEGLRDLVSATGERDCVRRIEAQADRLFPSLQMRIRPAADHADPGPQRLALRARGRVLGFLEIADGRDSAHAEALQAFVEHAAVALDNARLLDEHQRRARRDSLTGLRNHREFREPLAHGAHESARDPTVVFSLVILDLDRFKEVNDRGGHTAGDRLLRATAAALAAVCRGTDSAFRIGGDEFALILPGTGREQAIGVAARAQVAIERLDGSAGVSWGVAGLPEDGDTDDRLIAVADAAMYRRKGRPQPVAELDHDHVRRRLAVASRLASRLTTLQDVRGIASAVVDELHRAFGYFLAVVHRLEDDGMLRIVAGAGPLTESDAEFLAWEQSIHQGVNGRVARTCKIAVIDDTRCDPDYLARDPLDDPGSELSVPIRVGDRLWGVLNLEQMATHAFNEDDVLLAESVVAQMGAALHRCVLVDELEGLFAPRSTSLRCAGDARSLHARHTSEVAERSLILGTRSASTRADAGALLRARSYIQSSPLAKPARLTAAEYAEMQEHSAIGAELLARIPLLAAVAPLVRAVHERWDGSGYPDRLAGTVIPIESRIVAVCDAWDAMTSDRPYRQALGAADARAELARGAGSQFDPTVVAAFLEMQSRLGGGA